MSQRKTHPFANAICLLGIATSAQAAAPDGRLFEPDRAWLERYDPTLISSRYFSEFIFESFDGDGNVYKNEHTLRWGIPWRDDIAFGIQAMAPVKWTEAAGDDAFGLGDLELRTGIVGRLAPTLRYGFAVNAVLDSATDPLLGGSAFVLRPITALRWDYSDSITLGINAEYNFTPLDEDTDDTSALELKFPVAFKINDAWSAFVSYNPRWDLLDESDRHRLEFGTAHVWGAENQYAWSIGAELPLTSENFEFKLATGFAFYF